MSKFGESARLLMTEMLHQKGHSITSRASSFRSPRACNFEELMGDFADREPGVPRHDVECRTVSNSHWKTGSG